MRKIIILTMIALSFSVMASAQRRSGTTLEQRTEIRGERTHQRPSRGDKGSRKERGKQTKVKNKKEKTRLQPAPEGAFSRQPKVKRTDERIRMNGDRRRNKNLYND